MWAFRWWLFSAGVKNWLETFSDGLTEDNLQLRPERVSHRCPKLFAKEPFKFVEAWSWLEVVSEVVDNLNTDFIVHSLNLLEFVFNPIDGAFN